MYVQGDHVKLLETLEKVETGLLQCSRVSSLPVKKKQKLLPYRMIINSVTENVPDFGIEGSSAS